MKRFLMAVALAACLGAQAQTPPPAPSLASSASSAQRSSTQAAKADAVAQASGFKITPVDDAWRAALPRDAQAATEAYLARLPADVRAKSDAYWEGGYWMQLWNLLMGLLIATVLLAGQRSARLRDWATRIGKGPLRRDALFGGAYSVLASVLSLPLDIHQGYVREHAYGMSTLTAAGWAIEHLINQGINVIIMAVLVTGLYAAIRRAGDRWWIWGTAGALGFTALLIALAPIVIDPLFNTYKPVEDGPVKQAVLQMAHADGVPVDNVYEFDASRQTTRISANVSGLFGSAAVRLNDNLLRRTSLPEIRAVMSHELGHYVLNHMAKTLFMLAVLIFVGFYVVQACIDTLLRRFAPHTGVRRLDDVASLPLLMAVFSIFLALATPALNAMTRVQEAEADRFGLNLSREPHGFAEAQLKLVEYRKADPGPVEEFIFFHHPSTRARIYDAMRWREAMMEAPRPDSPR